MSRRIEFFVPGRCQPGGSKRFLGVGKSGKGRVVDANPHTAGWKERVALVAAEARQKAGLTDLLNGPLKVCMTFYMPRPRSHFRSRAGSPLSVLLKDGAPEYHTGRPDALKLARACEDSLSGVIYRDDAQITCEVLWKVYATAALGQTEGVKIEIGEL